MQQADLLIAATCGGGEYYDAILGKSLAQKRTIARISNPEFQESKGRIRYGKTGH
ncbi:MAG: hypothetical protein R3B47_03320 [Bacteroidia bacterium]